MEAQKMGEKIEEIREGHEGSRDQPTSASAY